MVLSVSLACPRRIIILKTAFFYRKEEGLLPFLAKNPPPAFVPGQGQQRLSGARRKNRGAAHTAAAANAAIGFPTGLKGCQECLEFLSRKPGLVTDKKAEKSVRPAGLYTGSKGSGYPFIRRRCLHWEKSHTPRRFSDFPVPGHYPNRMRFQVRQCFQRIKIQGLSVKIRRQLVSAKPAGGAAGQQNNINSQCSPLLFNRLGTTVRTGEADPSQSGFPSGKAVFLSFPAFRRPISASHCGAAVPDGLPVKH